jgi:site-specific DNA recombinase
VGGVGAGRRSQARRRLLNSEIYAGRLVWNRRQWLKDPETGKRRYVDRPREEWQVRDVPHLRIVPAR